MEQAALNSRGGQAAARLRRVADGPGRTWLLLALAAVLPVLLSGAGVAYLSASRIRANAARLAFATARRVTDQVAAELRSQIDAAESLAASTALDRDDLAAFRTEAERVRASHPLWHTLELASPDGVQRLNLLRPAGAALGMTADLESFERLVTLHRPVVGGIGPVGPVSGQQLVTLRVPVLRDGALRAVLSFGLAPASVGLILRQASLPPDWVATVLDATGHIVARSMADAQEQGEPASSPTQAAIQQATAGLYRARTPEGIDVEAVFLTLPGSDGWTMHVAVPSDALDGPVRRSLLILTAGSGTALALACALAWLVGRDVAQRRADERARAAMALDAMERRLAVAVEAADLGTWRWEAATGAVQCSRRCRALLGLSTGPMRLRTRDLLRQVHPGDRRALAEAVRKAVRDGTRLETELRVAAPDGVRWLRATGRMQAGAGQPADLQGVAADVTGRKQAEAQRLGLQRRLAEAQEEERLRIARELHDQVGQTVTGLSLGLKALEAALCEGGAGSAAPRDRLRWLSTLAADIGRDVHRAAVNLRSIALDDLGLHRAVRAYAAEWGERTGIAVDVQASGPEDRLPPEVESAAYRVVQEALSNVARHAGARTVSVLLDRGEALLRLIVEDDGCGFDPDGADTAHDGRRRLGVLGIRERLLLVGGRLTLESAPGAGTSLFVHIPLPARAAA